MALMRRLAHVGYAGSLGMHDCEVSIINGGKALQTVHRVPPRLCVDGVLPCAVLAGWIDEITSLTFVLMDKTHRPGVSVTLWCEVLRPVRAGEVVVMVCRCLKAGKNLGFADASLFKDQQGGGELARGRHVKFLSMGKGWELSMRPWAFTVAHAIARRAVQHQAAAHPPPPREEDGPQGRQGEGAMSDY